MGSATKGVLTRLVNVLAGSGHVVTQRRLLGETEQDLGRGLAVSSSQQAQRLTCQLVDAVLVQDALHDGVLEEGNL